MGNDTVFPIIKEPTHATKKVLGLGESTFGLSKGRRVTVINVIWLGKGISVQERTRTNLSQTLPLTVAI